MRLDSEIAALSGDRPRQRRLDRQFRTALDQWRGSDLVAPILRDLPRFDARGKLSECPTLSSLMQHHSVAGRFVDHWIEHFASELMIEPLGEIDFRHTCSPGLATMQLAVSGNASLTLLAYEEIAAPVEEQSTVFADRIQHEIVISGKSRAVLYREIPECGLIESQSDTLAAGRTIHLDGPQSSRQICDVRGRLLVMQLARVAEQPLPSREVRIADGQVMRQSDGDKRDSQQALAIAVLGEMGRVDALPVLVEMASGGPDHLRWEALRQILAMDARAGFGVLEDIAQEPKDMLCEPACELKNNLLRQYPQLKTLKLA